MAEQQKEADRAATLAADWLMQEFQSKILPHCLSNNVEGVLKATGDLLMQAPHRMRLEIALTFLKRLLKLIFRKQGKTTLGDDATSVALRTVIEQLNTVLSFTTYYVSLTVAADSATLDNICANFKVDGLFKIHKPKQSDGVGKVKIECNVKPTVVQLAILEKWPNVQFADIETKPIPSKMEHAEIVKERKQKLFDED